MLTRRRFTNLSAAFAAATPFVAHAREDYPARSIRLIVPWPPGGGVDMLGARLIQQALGAQLGQCSKREERDERVVGEPRSQPLGHQQKIPYATDALPIAGAGPLRSAFEPVTLAISAPQGVFTHPKSGFRTIEEFAAAAKAKPGKLNVGVPGIGSSQHLTSGAAAARGGQSQGNARSLSRRRPAAAGSDCGKRRRGHGYLRRRRATGKCRTTRRVGRNKCRSARLLPERSDDRRNHRTGFRAGDLDGVLRAQGNAGDLYCFHAATLLASAST